MGRLYDLYAVDNVYALKALKVLRYFKDFDNLNVFEANPYSFGGFAQRS